MQSVIHLSAKLVIIIVITQVILLAAAARSGYEFGTKELEPYEIPVTGGSVMLIIHKDYYGIAVPDRFGRPYQRSMEEPED